MALIIPVTSMIMKIKVTLKKNIKKGELMHKRNENHWTALKAAKKM